MPDLAHQHTLSTNTWRCAKSNHYKLKIWPLLTMKHWLMLEGPQQPDICEFQLFRKLGTETKGITYMCVSSLLLRSLEEKRERERSRKVPWESLVIGHAMCAWNMPPAASIRELGVVTGHAPKPWIVSSATLLSTNCMADISVSTGLQCSPCKHKSSTPPPSPAESMLENSCVGACLQSLCWRDRWRHTTFLELASHPA